MPNKYIYANVVVIHAKPGVYLGEATKECQKLVENLGALVYLMFNDKIYSVTKNGVTLHRGEDSDV